MAINPVATDILIIGAGPAGCSAAALLQAAGLGVLVVERQTFPRFVIGESLLPRCLDLLEEAGLLSAVRQRDYMRKNGALFLQDDKRCRFSFSQQVTPGWDHAYQVPRADFDWVLAQVVMAKGVAIRWRHTVTDIAFATDTVTTQVQDGDGETMAIRSRFVLDASGFGRVLPKLLALDEPSPLPPREALFTHVSGDIRPPEKEAAEEVGDIWICRLPETRMTPEQAWIWIIPFADGTTSVGVVASPAYFRDIPGDADKQLAAILRRDPNAAKRLAQAEPIRPVQRITGFARRVKSMAGPGYALLGNATEFLDPIFSSGVTLALESANRAAKVLIRDLAGEKPDWQADYVDHMQRGLGTFRTFVEAWYEGGLAKVFFYPEKADPFPREICSVLAGYVWNDDNPMVRDSAGRLGKLIRHCSRPIPDLS